jgi:hypothetical protein
MRNLLANVSQVLLTIMKPIFVNEKYQIDLLLGRGTFGEVYQGKGNLIKKQMGTFTENYSSRHQHRQRNRA